LSEAPKPNGAPVEALPAPTAALVDSLPEAIASVRIRSALA
jgi:hypothetical protein